jgi:hypothetical protein
MYTIDIHDIGIPNLADTFLAEHTELPIGLVQAALLSYFRIVIQNPLPESHNVFVASHWN